MPKRKSSRDPLKPTQRQIKLAHKVLNDIHEGVDCGESRAQLREVINTWGQLYDDLDHAKQHKSFTEVLSKLEQVLRPKTSKARRHEK